MRSGFTTGSCAAAAAKAAAYMLLFGAEKKSIKIKTPGGAEYEPEILDISRSAGSVSCAVKKDGGDDPDITSGALIYAEVSLVGGSLKAGGAPVISIDGGTGVGRVTKPGLDQSVGSAAINTVPRMMIKNEVLDVCAAADFSGELRVVISVPDGEALAKKTFNPSLGVVGGISIIGTSGIVEPMSMRAIVETIRISLRQKREMGVKRVFVSPGNYGAAFLKEKYGIDLDESVKCSNFIGETIDMAAETGFDSMLLAGHIGKLVKVAGGMMNTHSGFGDCRMEILSACAIKAGADADTAHRLLDCIATDEALRIIMDEGLLEPAMRIMMDRIMYHLEKRTAGRIKIDCVVFSNKFGVLASTLTGIFSA